MTEPALQNYKLVKAKIRIRRMSIFFTLIERNFPETNPFSLVANYGSVCRLGKYKLASL
jgi:hypothetical protein